MGTGTMEAPVSDSPETGPGERGTDGPGMLAGVVVVVGVGAKVEGS